MAVAIRGLLALSAFLERMSKGFATLGEAVNECTEWLCRMILIQEHTANGRKLTVRRTMVVFPLNGMQCNQLKSVK